MAKEIKTIGVLTSGGDAPGMNAAIRAVVRTAVSDKCASSVHLGKSVFCTIGFEKIVSHYWCTHKGSLARKN